MSKLRDRIRSLARKRRGGLGFAPPRDADAGGQLLVLAEVAEPAGAQSAVEAGAGAILYAGDPATISATVDAAGELPVGCLLEAATNDQVTLLADAGADFVILDDGRATAEALLERRLGHALLLDADPDEERLRMLAPLDLDALLLTEPLGTLTVRDHLRLRRIVALALAPLIVTADTAAGVPAPSTLEVWRDAGAPVVLLRSQDHDAIAALVRASNEVRPPRDRSDERPDALLPATAPAVAEDDDFD